MKKLTELYGCESFYGPYWRYHMRMCKLYGPRGEPLYVPYAVVKMELLLGRLLDHEKEKLLPLDGDLANDTIPNLKVVTEGDELWNTSKVWPLVLRRPAKGMCACCNKEVVSR